MSSYKPGLIKAYGRRFYDVIKRCEFIPYVEYNSHADYVEKHREYVAWINRLINIHDPKHQREETLSLQDI